MGYRLCIESKLLGGNSHLLAMGLWGLLKSNTPRCTGFTGEVLAWLEGEEGLVHSFSRSIINLADDR